MDLNETVKNSQQSVVNEGILEMIVMIEAR